MAKRQISADYLYKYWKEHHLTIAVLASKMGVSEGIVRGCFKHSLNRHGKPLHFSKTNLEKLNAALEQIAQELHDNIVTFGSDRTFTNTWDITYDPGTLEAINRLCSYFNMKAMLYDVLKWEGNKCYNILSIANSPVYGNVTREDCDRINTELSSIAGTLRDVEVVAEDS